MNLRAAAVKEVLVAEAAVVPTVAATDPASPDVHITTRTVSRYDVTA